MTTTPPEPPPGSPDQPPATESGAPGSASDTGTATQERPHDPHDDGRGGPRVTGAEVRDLSRLRRSTGDRKVAGVAGGLARHLDVDPLILRVGFVVLAFFGGAGLILYAAIWALVPEEDRDRASVHLDERSRTVALVALGVIAALALVGDSWGAFWFPWPLLVIGVIAFVWLGRQRDDARSERTDAPWQPGRPGEPTPGVAPGGYAAWDPAGHGQPPAAYVPPRPRDPRKRGPVLFWFTLLLLLVTEGTLAIVDAAGGPVADSAYAALAVGVVALMLVVGSFVGRAGGLIALGLVAAVGLVAATAADRWDGERLDYRPTSIDQVRDTYTMDTGSLTLDLTGLDDPAALDGRTIELRGNVGQIEVIVPDDSTVETDVEISGPGGFDLYDGRYTGGGVGAETVRTHRGATDDPSFTLLTDLEVGQVSVDVEGQ